METFKLFLEQEEFVDFVLNEFNSVQEKPWSAKKAEILQMWQNLRMDVPIFMTPVSKKDDAAGGTSSYGEDGIRISGSYQFISAVLGRLKSLLTYENPNTKLRLVFRSVSNDKALPNKRSYVFYINSEHRSKRKKTPKLNPPVL